MKFIDIFAGIGGFHSGMEQAGHKCVGWIEWDKYARLSYQAIYDMEGIYNAEDIQTVSGRDLPNADIWCFGSPCTNISVAGNQKGLGGEQSRMFFEVIRLLKERTANSQTKPAYLLMENVKNLLSSNDGWDFARVQIEMDKAGYDVEWQVINSSWVIPQNRERVYIVGHKRGIGYKPVFPISRTQLEKKRKYNILHDVLEEHVDSNFYLSEDKAEKLLVNNKKPIFSNPGGINVIGNPSRIAKQIERIYDARKHGKYGSKDVFSADGLSPTLNTMQGGGREPRIFVKKDLRIRKLTPRECWRLQGFTGEQFDKAENAGISNSQLYKQAGNAVTVPVVEAIAEKLDDGCGGKNENS